MNRAKDRFLLARHTCQSLCSSEPCQQKAVFFMAYNDYLQTQHWKKTRQEKIDHRDVCQVCGSNTSLHVHHKYYTDEHGSILGRERKSQLVTLCNSCHKLVHHYFGIEVKKLNKKILRVKRLMEFGVIKSKAFWIVSQNNEIYQSFYQVIVKGQTT